MMHLFLDEPQQKQKKLTSHQKFQGGEHVCKIQRFYYS